MRPLGSLLMAMAAAVLLAACARSASTAQPAASMAQPTASPDACVPVDAKDGTGRFPLRVAPGCHTLLEASGAPFRIHGDAAWSLIANTTLEEAVAYLDDRRARGVNAVIVNLVERYYAAQAPAGLDGVAPFAIRAGGAQDLSAPVDAYFARAEQVVAAAEERGIAVLLVPLYLGYGGGVEGWWRDLNDPINTQEVCLGYGRWVGRRFSEHANVVWVIGGDYTPPAGSEGEARVRRILEGIRAEASQLVTAHWSPESLSTDAAAFTDLIDLNAVYSYDDPVTRARVAYARFPSHPAFVVETTYENEHGIGRQALRALMWRSALSAVGGVVFGNAPIWAFGASGSADRTTPPYDTWQHALDAPGSRDFRYLGAFLDGIAWWRLEPPILGGPRPLVRGDAVAAADPGGTVLVTYGAGAVTLALSSMPGTPRARWYDPTNGAFTSADGAVDATGMRIFTPPGANAAGDDDWALVVDTEVAASARRYPAASARW